MRIGVAFSENDPYEPQVPAMADFVNAELGGAAGRPIEIVPCDVGSGAFGNFGIGADERSCATTFRDDPGLVAVLAMTYYKAFEETLGDAKPLLVTFPRQGTAGTSYHAGNLEILDGLALLGTSLLPPEGPQQIAVLGEAGEAGIFAGRYQPVRFLDVVAAPKTVTVTETETIVAAIQAAAAEDAPVVAAYAPSSCGLIEEAYAELGKAPIIIAPSWCAHDGWYSIGDAIDSTRPEHANGEFAVVTKLLEYGGERQPDVGRAQSAADLLALVRALDRSAATGWTPAALTAELQAYDGPALIGEGRANSALHPATTIHPNGGCTVELEVNRVVGDTLVELPPIDLDR